jgi:hypothetical protein
MKDNEIYIKVEVPAYLVESMQYMAILRSEEDAENYDWRDIFAEYYEGIKPIIDKKVVNYLIENVS